jgi:acyl-CoA thioesterase
VGDREILTVNAALGRREIGVSGNYASCPDVPRPEDCEPDAWRSRLPDTMSIEKRADIRLAMGRVKGGWVGDRQPEPGRSALWVKMGEGLELSSATLAIIADWVPSGLSQSVRGGRVGGNSLDNTIRIYDLYPTEWVLCDIRIHGIQNGFGHGTAHLWTEDGKLMATASQSLIVREWTKEQMEQLEKTMKPKS